MRNMFAICTNLEKINLGKIKTSSVEDMSSFFYSCSKLISLS